MRHLWSLGVVLVLAQGAAAQRLEWARPDELELRGADTLKLKHARLVEWSRTGAEREVDFDCRKEADGLWRLHPKAELRLQAQHALIVGDGRRLPLLPGAVLDDVICPAPMGRSATEPGVFRLFAPRALAVRFHLYATPLDAAPLLVRDAKAHSDGSWTVQAPEALTGMAWTWSVDSPTGVSGWTDPALEFADPWATAVVTGNTHEHVGRALVVDESYPWRATDWRAPDPASLIILEAHLKDLTAGPGAGAGDLSGTYPGFVHASTGGLAHVRDLGVTAVEFLPLQDFGNVELPFDRADTPVRNTWNPYERNHWGYMTSAFLAPESWYASGQEHGPAAQCGADGRQVREFKAVVDACHQAGIAVLMDVVYNHVSQYDRNPLKCLDMAYWFRLNDDGTLSSASGCGNDLATERPMARRLILDSVLHFADQCRVDGFRFDLGAMLDDSTLALLHTELDKRGLYHTAEPWGGGRYEPERFASLGFAWWNDRYRVDLRGRQPAEGSGFLFGRLHAESSPERLAMGVQGWRKEAGGCNADPLQATNYVAAHDDHDLGDWIKIGLGLADGESVVAEPLAYQTLTPRELAVHGLAALHLLSSAGVPMIHSGQELGRSKLIAGPQAGEGRPRRVDHNSYEKDNATNWIDWRLKRINGSLVDVYRQAIAFRRAHPQLARAERRLVGTPSGSTLAWICPEAKVAAAFNSNPAAPWTVELGEMARLAVVSGGARREGTRLVLEPCSAALVELP